MSFAYERLQPRKIGFTVSARQHAQIAQVAQAHGLSVYAWIKQLALSQAEQGPSGGPVSVSSTGDRQDGGIRPGHRSDVSRSAVQEQG